MNNLFALIKKGILCKSVYVRIPFNKSNLNVIKYIYKKGYIFSYVIKFKYVYVYLKYYENKPLIQNIFINNKKKKHTNKISYKTIKKYYLNDKNDIFILSKIGIIDIKKALYYKIGGNLLINFTI